MKYVDASAYCHLKLQLFQAKYYNLQAKYYNLCALLGQYSKLKCTSKCHILYNLELQYYTTG